MALLRLFDESQTRLADFGYIRECKSKNPRGLNEISLPLARMAQAPPCIHGFLHQFSKGSILILRYIRGQLSVNKCISVLSNYFDVSFEIYYVRLKYIDSIGQVVKLLILRPASIYCTFKPGHVGSLER